MLSKIVLIMCPLCSCCFSIKCLVPRLLRFPQGGLTAILRFRAKSEEGLGDLSLLSRETTTSWPGSYESSRLLSELSTAAGPLLLGPLALDSAGLDCSDQLTIRTPFDEQYTCIIPVKLPDYALCFYRLIIPEIMPA